MVLAHGYIVIFAAVALDCAVWPIPGEILLSRWAGQGLLDPASGIVAAAAGVLVADGASYWVGRVGGRRVFAKVRLGQRWTPGVTALIFGRFVIGARMIVAPLAGARRPPFVTVGYAAG